MRTILVTGGAGFVGSALCQKLVERGDTVIALDRYSTGSPKSHVDGVEYRKGHTKDISVIVPEKVDLIYHLGEYSRVAKSLEEPEQVFDSNIIGTLGVLEFWRAQKCKLIYAGSSTKFGESNVDAVEARDLSPYSWAKAAMSELVVNFARWYSLKYAIAYFYNVYGPGERGDWKSGYGTVIEAFRQNAIAGNKCQINGTGEQRRPFTHIDDTVDALLLIGDKGVNDEYSISAKETHSIHDVAKMLGCETEFHPATKSSRSSEPGDTSNLEALGWSQKHTLLEYLQNAR